MNNQNWKGNNNKSRQTFVWCCGSVVDGGSCGAAAEGWDCIDGIGPIGSYEVVGGRVCSQHQNILKLMSFSIFHCCNTFSVYIDHL